MFRNLKKNAVNATFTDPVVGTVNMKTTLRTDIIFRYNIGTFLQRS